MGMAASFSRFAAFWNVRKLFVNFTERFRGTDEPQQVLDFPQIIHPVLNSDRLFFNFSQHILIKVNLMPPFIALILADSCSVNHQ